MPFWVLIGLVLFAAGLVRIVKIDAAGQSKTRRDRDIKLLGPGQKTFGSADLIDWSLFESGGDDPRSTLQRSGSQR